MIIIENNQNDSNKYDILLNFAKSINNKQNLINPNNQNSRTSISFSSYSRQQIVKWLQSPTANEKSLRNASKYMYMVSPHYYRLIQYYAGLSLWAYKMLPLNFNPQKINTKTYQNYYYKAANYLENLNVRHEMQKAASVAFCEGVFYGVSWQTKTSSFIQKLDPDICRLTSIVDGTWNFAVDMSKINEDEIDTMYPPEFRDMYDNYTKGDKNNYQEVPESISYCLKMDEANVEYSIPPFASVLPQLYDIENYQDLQESSTVLNNYKILCGEIPRNKDGNPSMEYTDVMKYYNHLANNLPQQVGAAVLPFPVNDINFEKSGGVDSVDIVSRAIEQYWQSVGSPATVHGGAKDTSAAIKLAIKNDEALVFLLMEQAQRLINRHLKDIGSTVKFKIQFLPITVFNQQDVIKTYKEAVAFGVAKSEYAAALGISSFDVQGQTYLEDEILGFNKITPMMNSHTSSKTSDTTGRPEVDEGDLSDEGARTRDEEGNDR